MPLQKVESSIQVNASQREVFLFHGDLTNLGRVIPLLDAEITQADFPMQKNSQVELNLKLQGIRLCKWKLRFVEWQEPEKIVDVEEGGIFDHFEHEHQFSRLSEGVTLIKDIITYEWKRNNPLTSLIDSSIIKVKLLTFLKIKHKATKRFLESSSAK